MNDNPRNQLIEIIRQYGPEIVDEPRRVEALLKDLCGEYSREIFALMDAARDRVALDLRAAAGSDLPPQLLIANLTSRLLADRPMAEDMARWAVESWAAALNVNVPPPSAPAEPPEATVPSDEVVQPAEPVVQPEATPVPATVQQPKPAAQRAAGEVKPRGAVAAPQERKKSPTPMQRTLPNNSSEGKSPKTTILALWGLAIVSLFVLLYVVFLSSKNQPQSAASSPTASTGSTVAVPAVSGTKQWSSAPAMQIDKTKNYTATVTLAKGGQFVIQLYPDKAPITVNSFVFLARQGFFNGVTFHRVLDGFMAQGGDPTGTGAGGPGYKFVNENSDLKFDKAGVVAMANAGRDTNGSQFFITFVPTAQLNGGYTIFGQVVSGMDVVNGIKRRDPTKNPTFTGDAISTVVITEK